MDPSQLHINRGLFDSFGKFFLHSVSLSGILFFFPLLKKLESSPFNSKPRSFFLYVVIKVPKHLLSLPSSQIPYTHLATLLNLTLHHGNRKVFQGKRNGTISLNTVKALGTQAKQELQALLAQTLNNVNNDEPTHFTSITPYPIHV